MDLDHSSVVDALLRSPPDMSALSLTVRAVTGVIATSVDIQAMSVLPGQTEALHRALGLLLSYLAYTETQLPSFSQLPATSVLKATWSSCVGLLRTLVVLIEATKGAKVVEDELVCTAWHILGSLLRVDSHLRSCGVKSILDVVTSAEAGASTPLIVAQMVSQCLYYVGKQHSKAVNRAATETLDTLISHTRSESLWRPLFPGLFSGLFKVCCEGHRSQASAALKCMCAVTSIGEVHAHQ
jgi:hypothetical protein